MAAVGLTTALATALSGLNVNQQQLAVLSNNIANANTAGYSREAATEQSIFIEGNGEGVNVADVTRQINQNLTNAVQQQNSTVGVTGVLSSYNNQIQVLLGQPGNNNSLDASVGGFFNGLQALAQTPQNNALQQAAVNSGVALAAQVQQTATGLQNIQYLADNDISNAVTNANTDINTIATLNAEISVASLQGQSVAGLQDQRDSALSDLAGYLNITTYVNSNGMINVASSNGVTLINNGTPSQLVYNAAGSVNTFANGTPMSALLVYATDGNGNRTGTPQQLASSGVPSAVATTLTSGKLAGLLQIRDQQVPEILDQLDSLAANLRDQVNTIQNAGSGYPGANSYTGQRAVNAGDVSNWSGSAQIAVLNASGQPVASPYSDEPNGVQPMTLDLADLNTGNGAGNPSMQGIVDAINQYFMPQSKVEVGNLNNIQMVSDSATLPGNPAQLQFDLNLDNISANPASIFITGVSVTPATGSNTTSVTSPVDIGVSSYTTTAGSNSVIINTTGSTSALTVGEKVYLSGPGTTVDGILAGNLTGFFTVTGVGTNSFTVNTASGATAQLGGTTNPVGTSTVTPPYATMPAGDNGRTTGDGLFTAAFGANSTAPFYTVTLNVAVDDGTGTAPSTSQITYNITNNEMSALNTYYHPLAANGDGTIVSPNSSQPVAQAILVDVNGNELTKNPDGSYVTTKDGYLEIKATGSTNTVVINSANSVQLGQPNNDPAVPASNQGFSQYFALNNFFKSNNLTATGDSVTGSAANLEVVQSIQNNPGLLALGTLTQNTQPVDPSAPPNYTYVLYPGSNNIIQQMASLSTLAINFPVAGRLSATSQTFGGYATAIIGATSSNTATATTNLTNAQSLLAGYQKQASQISGVNLDTELANTVIYQNAYAASARVITVTGTLFSDLINAIPT